MAFTYSRNFTDEEEKILKDSLLNPIDWINKAVAGKLSNCTGHGAKRRREELIAKGQRTVPATDLELMQNAFVDPGYKDRAARDAEELLRGES